MLQVYVTFYFIYWGYNYGFANIFYLIGWCAGIALFVRFAPRIFHLLYQHKTLATIISQNHREIRVLFALMSAVYFAGMLFLETYFASDFLAEVIQDPDDRTTIWWFCYFSLLISVIVYSCWGGMRKVLLTDRYQLAVAYFGFSVVLSYLLLKSFEANATNALVVAVAGLLIYSFLTVRYVRHGQSIMTQLTIGGATVVLGVTVVAGLLRSPTFSRITIEGPLAQISEPGGVVTLVGFTLLNILWQFCDASNFQRLRTIDKRARTPEEQNQMIRTVFRPITWMSPITWGLGILLGMAIHASGILPAGSEYKAFIGVLVADIRNNSVLAYLALICLGLAISSIMLSTADSSVLSFFQAIFEDVCQLGRQSARRTIFVMSAIALLIFAMIVAYFVKPAENALVLTVVATFNAQVLVASPVVVMLLFGRFSRLWTFLSLVGGSAAVWWATFRPPDGLNANVQLVFPILAGLAAGLAISLPSIFFTQSPTKESAHAKTR